MLRVAEYYAILLHNVGRFVLCNVIIFYVVCIALHSMLLTALCMYSTPTASILYTSIASPPDCHEFAPVLTFSIEKPIPALDAGSIRLLLQFTRLDSAGVGSVSSLETFPAVEDASVLAKGDRMSVSMSTLPYKVATWKMYTLRLKLEVLGVMSKEWSPYSAHLCISCDECKSLRVCAVFTGSDDREEGRQEWRE